MELKMRYYGDPVLREKAAEVTVFDEALKAFVKELTAVMYEYDGIGIAANQVGVLKRVFISDLQVDDGRRNYQCLCKLDGKDVPMKLIFPLAVVNPVIEPLSPEKASMPDGCLSFPYIYGPTIRYKHVLMHFQDVDGNQHTLEADGLLAHNLQHELDHLDGVLFIDRMESRELRKLETKLKRLRRETRKALKSK